MAAVVHGDAGAHAGADFGEIQTDPVGPADAVVFGDGDMAHVHPHPAGVIEDDPANGVIHEPAGKAGPQTQTGQGVCDVVFPAADPDFQRIGEFDSSMRRRRKTNHAFAETD